MRRLSEINDEISECVSKMGIHSKEFLRFSKLHKALIIEQQKKKEEVLDVKKGDIITVLSNTKCGVYIFQGNTKLKITSITKKTINGKVLDIGYIGRLNKSTTQPVRIFRVSKTNFFESLIVQSDLKIVLNRDTVIEDLLEN